MTAVEATAALAAALAVLVWPGRLQPDGRRRSCCAAGALAAVGRLAGRSRGAGGDSQLDLLAVIEAVAAQVRAGAVPVTAWRAAVQVVGGTDEQGSMGDPVEALRWWAGQGSGPPALWVAAAWQLVERTGAPLADVLDAVAAGIRQDAAAAAEIEASLAAPRATARLLGVLPLAGVGLGQLIGADPVAVLVGTAPGRWCAAAGIGLLALGHWWSRRMVHAVGRAA